ncbi:MAG: hypothetical protein V4642_05950 [Bacteroidota bacterium]
MSTSSYKDLEIDEDYEFQKKSWRAQRIGWFFLGLILLAAILGLFGSGYLSHSEVSKSNDIRVEYERFARYQTTSEIVFHITPQTPDTIVKAWISREYIDDFQIEQITPEPESSIADNKTITYTFRLARPQEPLRIQCFLKTGKTGFLKAHAGIENGSQVEFSQFVYP